MPEKNSPRPQPICSEPGCGKRVYAAGALGWQHSDRSHDHFAIVNPPAE